MIGYLSATTGTVPCIREAVNQYLLTGETDSFYSAWPGGILERAESAHKDLRTALVAAVKQRAGGLSHAQVPNVDTIALTRRKIEPMVSGLFPKSERPQVLTALERSIVFLTTANIESILQRHGGTDPHGHSQISIWRGWTRTYFLKTRRI